MEDSLALLESPNPVVTADQTYKLLYCLHNLTRDGVTGSFAEKEQAIRVALTNNLARAVVNEGTVPVQ